MNKELKLAKELLKNANFVVALTGAGISVESGIPDFRSPGGLWEKYDPYIYASYDYFLKDPSKFWVMSKDVLPLLEKARPNSAHSALAKLEKSGKLKGVITQNIDTLHQKAGSIKVIELHGSYEISSCLNCGKQYHLEDVRRFLELSTVPSCISCGEVIKPNVILFGEPLDSTNLKEAQMLVSNCDLMLILGSSLEIQPAASFPQQAKRSGAKIIQIDVNLPADTYLADIFLEGKAAKVLPLLAGFTLNK